MARADLIVSLVRAGLGGDRDALARTTEALIADERAKRHTLLADRLSEILQTPARRTGAHAQGPEPLPNGLTERRPARLISELALKDDARRSIDLFVEEQHRADVLRAHGVEPRNRMLLVGPPGNGKTSLAGAVAEALAVPFLVVSYEAVIGSFLGETAARLSKVFSYVRARPCVLFLDEFEALGKERGDAQETGEIKRVVSSLLTQIDALPSYVVVIGATNHAELLDRATWRRFQTRIKLPAPSLNDLAKYLEAFKATFSEPLGISAKRLAEQLGPISYAEAEEFCLDVRRRKILDLGESSLRSVARDVLKEWVARSAVARTTCDGEASPSPPAPDEGSS